MTTPQEYFAALAALTEGQDCSSIDAIMANPLCDDLAKRFHQQPYWTAQSVLFYLAHKDEF